jgi:hypothetical protein
MLFHVVVIAVHELSRREVNTISYREKPRKEELKSTDSY